MTYFRYMQYVSALTAASFATASHMITTWNSPSIPKLMSDNSPIGVPLTSEEASWVSSVPILTFIIGSIFSTLVLTIFGPKKTLIIGASPVIVSWMVIAFSNSVKTLIAMRGIAGFGDGLIMTALPLYMGEITDKDIRGRLTTMISLMHGVGNILLYAIGPFISYRELALLCCLVPLTGTTVFMFLPDCPYFLCKKGKLEESKKNLKRLISDNLDEDAFNDRFLEVQLTITSSKRKNFRLRDIFTKSNYRRAIILITGLKMFMYLSGISAIKSYLQTIIQHTNSSISSEITSLIFGVVQMPSVVLTSFLMDRVGRKKLYIVSAIGCSICLTLEGLYFYLQESSSELAGHLQWLPTLSLILYLIIIPVGMISVPYVIMGEVLAIEIKSFACSFATTVGAVISFFTTKYLLMFSDMNSMHIIFFIYAGSCMMAFLFAMLALPETKEKSFLEIQKILKTKSYCS